MSKINKFVISEIESESAVPGTIMPLGMHFDTSGTIFFSNGQSESKKVVSAGSLFGGTDKNSPDGFYSTLQLIPDQESFNNASDQYLIVEPQSVNRIHIRAGGQHNQSTAELNLGGQANHVSVSDANNSVIVKTQGTDLSYHWTFDSQGDLSPGGSLKYASRFPFTIVANLNAESYTGIEFAGNGIVYDVTFDINTTGTITASTNLPDLADVNGYNVGDSFVFGPNLHGFAGYNLELTIADVSANATATGFTANINLGSLPVLEPAIEAFIPVVVKAGSSRTTFATDGSLMLDNQACISPSLVDSRNSVKIQPSQDLATSLSVLSGATTDGNIIFVSSEDLALSSVALGNFSSHVRIGTDGNIQIVATGSEDSDDPMVWQFTTLGNIAAPGNSIYLKQSTAVNPAQGLYTAAGSTLTLSSGDNLVLQANAGSAIYSLSNNGEFTFPNASKISSISWQNTFPAIKISTDSVNADNLGLVVYSSLSSNKVYLAPTDNSAADFVFGSTTYGLNLARDNSLSLLSRAGNIAIPGQTGASDGGNVTIRSGDGGDNGGDPDFGSQGGHIVIESGFSTKNGLSGGNITLRTGSGYAGFGNINLEVDDKVWTFNKDGNLTFASGSIISGTANSTIITPPTATSAQSLMLRPTAATWAMTSSGFIVYGSPITISIDLLSYTYFGTVNYEITGPGVTQQTLGRALTGSVVFAGVPNPDSKTVTWTIPANSTITEFTFTLTTVDGTRSTGPGETDPALYYNFELNAMPTGGAITVTNNGVSNTEFSHIHLLAGDPTSVDLYLGDDDQYVKIEKNAGNVVIGTNNNTKNWTFGTNGNLTLPQTNMNSSPAPISLPGITFTDGTFQTTAYTGGGGGGAASTVDITNTNGLTTTYYPTFVESRTNGQYMRADVDLTYRTDDNLLRAGNIQVGTNIYGSAFYGISTAIQFRPNIDIDKRFLFTVDSSGGNYIRSGMEMPMAEVNKAVTLAFPHDNSTAGYIFNQGNDTNGTEWNNALVIFQNGGNVKIGTITGAGSKVWQFGSDGKFTIPGNTMLAGVQEKFNSFSSVSGVVSLDASVVQVFYITSPEANFTPNLIGLSLSSGHATAVTFVISQGATAYYPSALQINGVAQTINWQGNQTPTPTANRVDSVAFSILNNSGTYIVLGQMTGF